MCSVTGVLSHTHLSGATLSVLALICRIHGVVSYTFDSTCNNVCLDEEYRIRIEST